MCRGRPLLPTPLSLASPIGFGPSTPPPLRFPLPFALCVHSCCSITLSTLLPLVSFPNLSPTAQASQGTPLPCFGLRCLPARPRVGRRVRHQGAEHTQVPHGHCGPLAMFLSQRGRKPPCSAHPQLADSWAGHRSHTLGSLEVCQMACTLQAGVGSLCGVGGTSGSSSENRFQRTPGELSAYHQTTVMGLRLLCSRAPGGRGRGTSLGPTSRSGCR